MSQLAERFQDEMSPGEEMLSSGKAIQQVRSSFATAVAVQKPRDLVKVARRLEQEALLAGDAFYYGWGAGQNHIEGGSIKLALAAARCYGNCAVDVLPVQDLFDSWIFSAAFIDLETGFTLTRQFRMSKNFTVHGNHDAERKMDMRFQIGQSKAIRNVILNAVPEGLTAAAIEHAKQGIREKIEKFVADKGIAAAVDTSLKAMEKRGVKEDRVLEKFGVAGRGALTVEHLVILRGDMNAIDAGQERPDDLFPVAPTAPPTGKQTLRENGRKEDAKPDDKPGKEPAPANHADKATDEQKERLRARMAERGFKSAEKIAEFCKRVDARWASLTVDQVDRLHVILDEMGDSQE